MDFERIQKLVESAQNLEDYSSRPPFFGKDNWTVDPAKIVTRPSISMLSSIPEEEEEDVKETVETVVKTPPKRVRFASYVDICFRCPADGNVIKYPSKMFAEPQDDEIAIKDKRIEELEYKLKRARQELTRAYDHKLIIIMVSLVFIGLIMSYKYTHMDL